MQPADWSSADPRGTAPVHLTSEVVIERHGSEEVGARVVEAIGDNKAVLLANHGVQAVGVDVEDAFKVAATVEYTADLYLRALAIGQPKAMAKTELDKVAKIFLTYGQPPK